MRKIVGLFLGALVGLAGCSEWQTSETRTAESGEVAAAPPAELKTVEAGGHIEVPAPVTETPVQVQDEGGFDVKYRVVKKSSRKNGKSKHSKRKIVKHKPVKEKPDPSAQEPG
jgi:hypothetical protein